MKTNIITITTEINDIPNFISSSTISTNIWFSGCSLNCIGCHNQTLKTKQYKLDMGFVLNEVIRRKKLTDWIVILGGEPFNDNESIQYMNFILNEAKNIGYKTFIYSGYTYDDILLKLGNSHVNDFFVNVDYIKTGKYDIDNLNTNADFFLASTNQTIYDGKGNKVYFWDVVNCVCDNVNQTV